MFTSKKVFALVLVLFVFIQPAFSQDIFKAVEKDDIEQVKLLLEKNPELVNAKNELGMPLINFASNTGYKKIVELLIAKGADVNASDSNGHTSLHLAAFNGHIEVVELLISKGAYVDPKDVANQTPLFFAASEEFEIVKLLLANGASIDIPHIDGYSPLLQSISYGYLDISELLISKGADVNSETRTGKTPLHMAAIKGFHDMADLLIKNGSEINSKDNHDKLPIDYAIKYGNYKTAKLLRSNEMKEIDRQENVIWYLGHSGWGIKTGNNFLIFDYCEEGTLPDEPSLANGYINPAEIKDLNVYVFVSHIDSDHYNQCIFEWKDKIENITYIFGFQPENVPDYEFIGPREKSEIDSMRISTIESNDSGVGFLVEVNGLTLFHAGDHANRYRDFSGPFCGEIDYLSNYKGKIDIAFLPITGCGFGDQVAVKKGVYYTLENLAPKFMFPMHAGDYVWSTYKEFAKNALKENFDTQIVYAENRGDRFEFKNGRIKEME